MYCTLKASPLRPKLRLLIYENLAAGQASRGLWPCSKGFDEEILMKEVLLYMNFVYEQPKIKKTINHCFLLHKSDKSTASDESFRLVHFLLCSHHDKHIFFSGSHTPDFCILSSVHGNKRTAKPINAPPFPTQVTHLKPIISHKTWWERSKSHHLIPLH